MPYRAVFLPAFLVLYLLALPLASGKDASSVGLPAGDPPLFLFQQHAKTVYDACGLAKAGLPWHVFLKALTGYYGKGPGFWPKKVLAIADFDQPSSVERLYAVDLQQQKLLFKTLVAHGKNSGWEIAESFSNTPGSLQSSLGFYKTAETYHGKYGLSLKLDGLEPDINDKARERDIVMHPADYVSESFVKNNRRLGRSFGCPAIPYEKGGEVIQALKNGACLFIYKTEKNYFLQSSLLAVERSAHWFMASMANR